MSRRNYWTTLRQRKISRRTMLGASAKAGVGAAGLALVGCGDDDDDAAPAAVDTSAIDAAAGDASAAASAAGEASAAASEASAAASEAAAAASQAADAADAAAALAAEAAESEDAANAAAAAEAAAAAAAQAADAASAAGDAAAAAVADAAAQAAEAAAQAARDAAAAVEAGTATAAAAQAAIDNAAEAAAAAAAAAGEASAAAGAAAATAQETAEAAAETAAAAVAAAEEAAQAAREAADAATMRDEEDAPAATAGPMPGGIAARQSGLIYDTMDAQLSVSTANIEVLLRIQSKILRFSDPDRGVLTGDLAETWEAPSAQEVVLNLRPNVRWHSVGPGAEHPASTAGRPLTADDITYNIERQKGGVFHDGTEGPFGRQAYWASVDTIDTVDDTTMRLNLAAPNGTFLTGLANEFNSINQPELMEAVELTHGEVSADKVIGTGPFILTRWTPSEGLDMVRNPDYFLPGRPYLDGYSWQQAFTDTNAYRIAFEQKQLDSFLDPDPSVTQAIHDANADETNHKFAAQDNANAAYISPLVEPWGDPRLITAIHVGMDRRELIQQFHQGLGRVSGPVPWMQPTWAIPEEELAELPGYRINKDEDFKEAKALWDAAGGGELTEVDWTVPQLWADRPAWNSTGEIITTMFNRIFDTDAFKSRTIPYAELIPAWLSGVFPPHFGWIPNVETPDARNDINNAFRSGSPANLWGVADDEIDGWLQAALEETDIPTAVGLLRQVQEKALENGQFGRIILYNYVEPRVRWNYNHDPVKSEEADWDFRPPSLDGIETWLDQSDPSYADRPDPPEPTPI